MKYDGSIRSFILLFCHAQVGGKDEREIGGQDVSSMGTITQIFLVTSHCEELSHMPIN